MGLFDFVDKALGLSGKSDALEQNKRAIAAQKEMAGASNQTIRDMYQTGRQDQLPYMTPSLSALPMYQSAILGGPVEYADPRYQRLTTFDPEYNLALKQFGGDKNMQFYRAPDGSYTNKVPTLTANYSTEGDPGYQWRNQQLNRSLRALGRQNSTYGMSRLADFNGGEYDRSVNRLATLAGFGQGTAGNVAGQGNSAANQIAGVNTNTANSLSNLYGQRGSIYTEYSPLNMALNFGKVAAAGGM